VLFYVGDSFLNPAGEQVEREESVLTGALDPRIESALLLEDADLPEGVEPPKVGELTRYLQVTILYPDRPTAPGAEEHLLSQVNAGAHQEKPVHGEIIAGEDGSRVLATYRVSADFEWGQLRLGKEIIAEHFELD